MDSFMQGTRQRATSLWTQPIGGSIEESYTRDLGLNKLTTGSFTFASASISGASGSFSSFAANDLIRIAGTNTNDSEHQITAVGTSGASITVTPPTKTEGPVGATIRTV